MKRAVLISVLVVVSTYAFGCTCRQSFGSYFLNQVRSFDAIVEGKFYRDGDSGKGYLIADKIYKGNISNDTIQIFEGGLDCTEIFMDEPGEKLVLGLRKSAYESSPNTYSAPSCVTSVLIADENKVYSKTKFYNPHISNPRIGLFSTQIGRDKFAKKIRKRL
ncbi:hypothetical protein [Pontibacter pamirensis]|uniref:hypothetical protein n=1 Tax=Pontibacter pamirensis TaxID=2562824 RepID=UPI001389C065|nr:hypothetical protein [Pontibacter pamirensis]